MNKHPDMGNPDISPLAYIAESAVISGDVRIAPEACICHGAVIMANDGVITIGSNTVVMEKAVIRSSRFHHCHIGSNVMIGPHTHISGCTIEQEVFVATGVSVFNGAHIKTLAELRINAVVHVDSVVEAENTVPIGWVAVGSPAQFFSPDKHDEIWAIQKDLNFPKKVFGLNRDDESNGSLIKQITDRYSKKLIELHKTG